jgi:teichuronic acid biosynthesis glycosyltransferase TuaC
MLVSHHMKILWILPGSKDDKQNMIFAKRAIPALVETGTRVDQFYLESRSSLTYLVKSWFQLRKLIRDQQYNALHAQYGSVLGFFTWSLFHPYFVTLRGSDFNGDPAVSVLRRVISRILSYWVAFRSLYVFCVSEDIAKRVIVPSIVLPSPTDLQIFRPISVSEARSKLGINSSSPLVGFAGGARSLKRRDLARKACELAKLELLEIQNVTPEEMPFWLNACDILIFTSEKEGSPNVIREALACGLPIASVNVGDVKKWVDRDPCSKVVDATPEALASALRQIREKLPKRERRTSLEEITPSNYAKKLNEIYHREKKA